MRRRTTAAYRAALEGIKQLVPRFNPEEVMGDWERGPASAWDREFPRAVVYGCLFHYAKVGEILS